MDENTSRKDSPTSLLRSWFAWCHRHIATATNQPSSLASCTFISVCGLSVPVMRLQPSSMDAHLPARKEIFLWGILKWFALPLSCIFMQRGMISTGDYMERMGEGKCVKFQCRKLRCLRSLDGRNWYASWWYQLMSRYQVATGKNSINGGNIYKHTSCAYSVKIMS